MSCMSSVRTSRPRFLSFQLAPTSTSLVVLVSRFEMINRSVCRPGHYLLLLLVTVPFSDTSFPTASIVDISTSVNIAKNARNTYSVSAVERYYMNLALGLWFVMHLYSHITHGFGL